MPRNQRLLALLVVCLVALAAVPGFAAAETRASGSVVVSADETIDEGLTVVGGSIVVHGTVDGDLTAMGGSVVVDGTVNGDVTALGGTVDIAEGGNVTGSVTAAGGTVTVGGHVDGDLTVGAGTIVLAETASVGGDLRYDGTLTQHSGATVQGDIIEDGNVNIGPLPSIPGWMSALYSMIGLLAIGAVLLLFFPESVNETATAITESGGRSLLAGLGVLFVSPVVFVLFAFTLIGIPVTVVGFLLWALLLVIGYVLGNYALGRYALSFSEYENRWVALLLGVFLVLVVDYVPVLGGFVQFALLLLGTGALARLLYRRARNQDEDGGAEKIENVTK